MILESLTGGKVEGDNRQVIVQKIQDELKEKRYLLVLDDLWNNNQDGLLDDFFNTLAGLNAKKGSWCLVTSRLQEVETILSRHPQINFTRHELGRLCDDVCWSIVKNWANVGEEVPRGLEDIREQVLGRCDGLPLAAKLIGGSWIRTLPESLCKLYSLQTLRIDRLEDGFPKEMSSLISMRHLHCDDYYTRREIQMPSGIRRWTCLQTLEFFNTGRQEEGRGIQELGTLEDLKGSLEIRNLELVNGKDDAELANLSKKPNLHRLVFEWGNRIEKVIIVMKMCWKASNLTQI
nr:putative late blight resistance protein homolog R1B-23 [Coffea arabica]